jgi:hypothetical protein
MRKEAKRSGFISLGDAIGQFAKENHLQGMLQSAKISELFRSLLPESSRALIGKVDFSNGILRAQVKSPSLRNDLHFASSSLCDMMNEKLEAPLVKKIVLY